MAGAGQSEQSIAKEQESGLRPKGAVAVKMGFLAGTVVETPDGPKRIEELMPGDEVLTYLNGPQRIRAVQSVLKFADAPMVRKDKWHIHVPEKALGNQDALELQAEQGVLVVSEAACDSNGDTLAIVPAGALAGFQGIAHVPPYAWTRVIEIETDEDEVLIAGGGALLFGGDSAEAMVAIADTSRRQYDVFSEDDADLIVQEMPPWQGVAITKREPEIVAS